MQQITKDNTALSALFLAIAMCVFFQSFGMSSKSVVMNDEYIIELAIALELPTTNVAFSKEAMTISEYAFEEVKKGQYPTAIAITLNGLNKFPHDFTLQADYFAARRLFIHHAKPAERKNAYESKRIV